MSSNEKAAGIPSNVHSRAKFRCQSEKTVRFYQGQENFSREYTFTAAYDNGTPENKRFAKATPTGQLTFMVDNPDVVYEPGRDYYLDFILVPLPEEVK